MALSCCLGRTFTGAWVETAESFVRELNAISRTFTGAWVETSCQVTGTKKTVVAPSQVRGLKLCPSTPAPPLRMVAPSQVRGLKRWRQQQPVDLQRVAPSQVRGLKLAYERGHYAVAPSQVRGLKL